MTQLMTPGGKDKIQSTGTAKLFLGMMIGAILCFATKRASFSARPQALRASHCVADELPAPHTSQKPPCRHRWDGSWCKDTTSVAITNVWSHGRRHRAWDGAIEDLPASTGMWDGQTVKHPCCLLWALTEGWLIFGGQALTSLETVLLNVNCSPEHSPGLVLLLLQKHSFCLRNA